ncbi:5186_t:CDS:2 [Cetraspora pellucida]|uniref:5186_t:CDS:1 n=1 Tax=Cetraspora pellucida TaxID=1433469 RepID=A0A9N9IID1_9GLOM|nr:5186_t:CDS:2 [Cetraspora pellucida]
MFTENDFESLDLLWYDVSQSNHPKPIGSGAFADVYYLELKNSKCVALKIFRISDEASEEIRKAILREYYSIFRLHGFH